MISQWGRHGGAWRAGRVPRLSKEPGGQRCISGCILSRAEGMSLGLGGGEGAQGDLLLMSL